MPHVAPSGIKLVALLTTINLRSVITPTVALAVEAVYPGLEALSWE
jgi:hypothetical protein